MYISKDVISQDDDDTLYDYSSFAFNSAIELLNKPNGYDALSLGLKCSC